MCHTLDFIAVHFREGPAVLIRPAGMDPFALRIDLERQDQSIVAMYHKFWQRSLRCGDDGCADSERLDGAESERVAKSGKDREVCAAQGLNDLVVRQGTIKRDVIALQQFKIRIKKSPVARIAPNPAGDLKRGDDVKMQRYPMVACQFGGSRRNRTSLSAEMRANKNEPEGHVLAARFIVVFR